MDAGCGSQALADTSEAPSPGMSFPHILYVPEGSKHTAPCPPPPRNIPGTEGTLGAPKTKRAHSRASRFLGRAR